jgi:hypothetical protein
MRSLVLALTDGLPAVILPIFSIVAGLLVFLDARRQNRDRPLAAMAAFIVTGLLLAGSVPALVALAVADGQAAQGFPTALRIVPGLLAIAVYLFFRSR